MLVQYAVENYKSIRDEVVINFSANKKYSDSDWVAQEADIPMPLYKCIGLIGPNASGKSNIIQSFSFAIRFILFTIKRKDNSEIHIEKFAFDQGMEKKPTSFEFIFYKDKVKYVYGFSVSKDEVIEEYLMGYFSAKPKTIFERNMNQQYEFKGNDVKTQKEIAKKTNANRLYMPVAAEWGYAPLKKVYEWFEFISRQYIDFDISHMISEIITKLGRKDILISELQKADFNIKDIYIKNRKMNKKSYDALTKIMTEVIGVSEEFTISDTNPFILVVHENCMGETYDIALDEDSAGTESIVGDIAEVLYLSEQGGIMLEDELGQSYHTKLAQHFLHMFQSSVINPGNLQLFFATHNTKLLNMLNPDQLYLVDKDETGKTFVKLLDEYVIRENDNLELGYLKGRYGAVPYMKG